jgi:hypothetical protein
LDLVVVSEEPSFSQIFSGNDAKKPRDYEGPREAKGIVEHVSKQAGPATVPLNDAAAVKAFQKLEGDKTCAGEISCLCPYHPASH